MGPLPCALRSRPSLRILPCVAGTVFWLRERILQSGGVMVGMTWHENCAGPAGAAAAPGRPGRPGRRQSGSRSGAPPAARGARPASPRRCRSRGGARGRSPCRIRRAVAFSLCRVAFSAAVTFCGPQFLSCRSCSCVVAPQGAFPWPVSSAGSPSAVKPVPRQSFGSASALPLEVVGNFQARKTRARAHIEFS